nr:MAG TPA: tail protein [Caudoviricetes sp.]
MRKELYSGQAWNTAGSNRWQLATLQQWLRDTYINYLNISSIVKSVKIPYAQGLSTSTVYTGASGLTSTAFLLSCYELGWTTNDNYRIPVDGAKLSYFDSGTGDSANTKRVAYMNGHYEEAPIYRAVWWTRDPNTSNSTDVFYVASDGSYTYSSATGECYIRPCFIIPSDTEVDEFGNIVV